MMKGAKKKERMKIGRRKIKRRRRSRSRKRRRRRRRENRYQGCDNSF